jgi:hypothetical protein
MSGRLADLAGVPKAPPAPPPAPPRYEPPPGYRLEPIGAPAAKPAPPPPQEKKDLFETVGDFVAPAGVAERHPYLSAFFANFPLITDKLKEGVTAYLQQQNDEHDRKVEEYDKRRMADEAKAESIRSRALSAQAIINQEGQKIELARKQLELEAMRAELDANKRRIEMEEQAFRVGLERQLQAGQIQPAAGQHVPRQDQDGFDPQGQQGQQGQYGQEQHFPPPPPPPPARARRPRPTGQTEGRPPASPAPAAQAPVGYPPVPSHAALDLPSPPARQPSLPFDQPAAPPAPVPPALPAAQEPEIDPFEGMLARVRLAAGSAGPFRVPPPLLPMAGRQGAAPQGDLAAPAAASKRVPRALPRWRRAVLRHPAAAGHPRRRERRRGGGLLGGEGRSEDGGRAAPALPGQDPVGGGF